MYSAQQRAESYALPLRPSAPGGLRIRIPGTRTDIGKAHPLASVGQCCLTDCSWIGLVYNYFL
jgi:hypothetical protein